MISCVANRACHRYCIAVLCVLANGCNSIPRQMPSEAPPPAARELAQPEPARQVETAKEPPVLAAPPSAVPGNHAPATRDAVGDPDTNIFFDDGGAVIKPEGQRAVRRMSERLLADPRLTLVMIGHANALGSRSYCVALAAKRISVVQDMFRKLGIGSRQLRRRVLGCESAAASACRDESCARLLRRVELKLQVRKPPPHRASPKRGQGAR